MPQKKRRKIEFCGGEKEENRHADSECRHGGF